MWPFKKFAVVLLIGVIGLFLQGTVLKAVAPQYMVVPNVLLIIVVFLAFYDVSPSGVVLAFLLGLLIDLGTGVLLGPWAAAFVGVYGLLSSISQRLFVDSSLAIVTGVFCSSLLASFIYLALLFQFKPAPLGFFSFSFVLFFEALLSALIAPPAFSLLRRLLLPRAASGGTRYRASGV